MTEWDKKQPNQPKTDSRREWDEFWSAENLLPRREPRKAPQPTRKTPTAVEVELTPRPAFKPTGSVSDAPLTAVTHYVPPHKASERAPDEPLSDYVPDGHLLHRVRVFGWQSNYHYFDQFSEDALRYAAMTPPDMAQKESFFSYFPQYVQMNRRQTAWYLFWRERVRGGQYPDTDYAYVLLYLFELINLPAEDNLTARGYRDAMASAWMAYRRAFPQLDHYMCEWLCDYCLIHALTAPVDILAPALDAIIEGSRLREFYLSAAVRLPKESAAPTASSLETARILLRHCCQYDYRKSKFASGEHRDLYDRVIPAAIASVLPLLLGSGDTKPAVTMLDSTVLRDAYTGALCSYQNKRKIEVSYTSFSRSHELRFLIADMVKHVENRIRGWIGVRSRLSVMSLPIPLRDALDAYLNPLTPPKSSLPIKKKDEPRPAYEALYDLPRKRVSVEDAASIEAASWETTRILTEAFGGDADEPIPTPSPMPAEAPTEAGKHPAEDESQDELATALSQFVPFVRAVAAGDRAAAKAFAASVGKMPDALVDEINTAASESDIGDILIEEDGMGGYALVEDYRDELLKRLHISTEN